MPNTRAPVITAPRPLNPFTTTPAPFSAGFVVPTLLVALHPSNPPALEQHPLGLFAQKLSASHTSTLTSAPHHSLALSFPSILPSMPSLLASSHIVDWRYILTSTLTARFTHSTRIIAIRLRATRLISWPTGAFAEIWTCFYKRAGEGLPFM